MCWLMLTWSADCCSMRTVSAEVMQPEQARQSASVMEAFSSFLAPPPATSSTYDPSASILIFAPELVATFFSTCTQGNIRIMYWYAKLFSCKF